MNVLTGTQGDTFVRDVTLSNEDGPFNLAFCKVWWTVKRRTSIPDNLASIQGFWEDSGASIYLTVADLESGVVRVTVPAEIMANLSGEYLYDFQVSSPDPTIGIRTVSRGKLSIEEDITQSIVAP